MANNEGFYIGKHYLMKQAFGQKELHEREAVCTREEPPSCTTNCPLNMDLRTMCEHVAKGDFKRGAAVLRQTTPFLYLICSHCERPCEKKCVLQRAGDGVRLHAIVKACAMYGGSSALNAFMLPKKKETLGVIGDNLYALACCYELGKMGFEIIWYTKAASMKEVLLKYAITEEEAKGELCAFSGFRITTNTVDSLKEGEKAATERELDGVIKPMEFETKEIQKMIIEAKKAVHELNCILQGVHVTDGKQYGSYESRLFVTMEDETPSLTVCHDEPVTKETAVMEAKRCIVCECRECIKGCVYLQDYKKNPKASIREIYNNMSIVMGNHMANGMINACDECGQCKAACPNDFDYPDVIKIARETMVETEKMPSSTHEFALNDQIFSNGEAFLAKPQKGYETCAYVFFPGCQMSAVSPQITRKAYEDLCDTLEGGVGLILGCCGAISSWAGRKDILNVTIEKLNAKWENMGRPVIICGCPTCLKNMSAYLPGETKGIWEVISGEGNSENRPQRVTIQDACAARGDNKMQTQIRAFVNRLGVQVTEEKYSGDVSPCCGYGGLVKYANPKMSMKKAAFAASQGNDNVIITYCMACKDQLLRAGAKGMHILELYYGLTQENIPDISQRRYNRLVLKQQLLAELWEEEMDMKKSVSLRYEQGVEELLEERMILKTDISQVITHYEETNEAVLDEESQVLITCARVGNVTFWVRFIKEDDCYVIKGAYSHRMTVE